MKAQKIIKYLFLAIGLGMLIGGIYFLLQSSSFRAKAKMTTGTVVDRSVSISDGSQMYTPIIEFQPTWGENIRFHSSVASSPPKYSIGDKVEVYYLPDDPSHAKIASFMSIWLGPLALSILGLIFSMAGFIWIYKSWQERKKEDYLQRHGITIQASFQRVIYKSSTKVNGRSPYRIIAQWQSPKNSKVYVFESDNIWFNPRTHIHKDTIPVLIKEENPSIYEVDLSFLPERAE